MLQWVFSCATHCIYFHEFFWTTFLDKIFNGLLMIWIFTFTGCHQISL
jgi:hypothetical protein